MNDSFRYEAGLPQILYWVQPEYRQAFQRFSVNYGYGMIHADEDLCQVAAKIISGDYIFHVVLGQEMGGRDYRDDTTATDGEKLITLLEHIFHSLDLERGEASFRIPSVLMRPRRPKNENFSTAGDYRAIFPPFWPNLDQTLEAAFQFGYGLPTNGHSLRQNPEALSNFKFAYDVEKIYGTKTYTQLLDTFRTR